MKPHTQGKQKKCKIKPEKGKIQLQAKQNQVTQKIFEAGVILNYQDHNI